MYLQSSQVLAQGVAHQCGTIPLGPARGLIGGPEKLLIEDNLNGFHIVDLIPQYTPQSKTRCRGRTGARASLRAVPLPGGEVLAEFGLQEFSGGGVGKLLDADEVVGDLPAGEAAFEEGAQLGGIDGAVFGDDDGERALLPLGMRHGDDGSFADGLVGDEGVFEVDGADPLAAGLDEVFEAVGDLDVAFGVDGGDVSGLEPAVGGPSFGLLTPP